MADDRTDARDDERGTGEGGEETQIEREAAQSGTRARDEEEAQQFGTVFWVTVAISAAFVL